MQFLSLTSQTNFGILVNTTRRNDYDNNNQSLLFDIFNNITKQYLTINNEYDFVIGNIANLKSDYLFHINMKIQYKYNIN